MRPPSRSRRLTPGGLRASSSVPAAGERPAPGRGAAAAGRHAGQRHAATAADAAGQAPASSQGTPTHGLHPPLGIGVGLRSPDRRSKNLNTLGGEHLVEGTGVLGVVVAQQEADRAPTILQLHRRVPGLVGDPRRARMRRNPSDGNAPGAELDDEQHTQRLQPDRPHGEAAARHGRPSRRPQELRPGRSGASRRGPRPRRRGRVRMVVAPTRMLSLRSPRRS
jgi:hypothetical protein